MAKYRSKKEKNFEKKMMDQGRFYNILFGLLISIYILYLSDIRYDKLSSSQIILTIFLPVVVLLVMQFLVAPRTNHIITRKISRLLQKEVNETLTVEERTTLVKSLINCPLHVCIQVFIIFFVSCIICIFTYRYKIPIKDIQILFMSMASLFGSFEASIMAFNYAHKLCSKISIEEIKTGNINVTSFSGNSYNKLIFFYIIVPIILMNLLQVSFFFKSFNYNIKNIQLQINTVIILFINSSSLLLMAGIFVSKINNSILKMNTILEEVSKGKITEELYLPTDLSTEIDFNIYQLNTIIKDLDRIFDDKTATSFRIQKTTKDLFVFSTQLSDLSNTQSQNINSTVVAMERAKNTLHDVTKYISEVSLTANKTLENVSTGNRLLQENTVKMEEITQANVETIYGIKVLSEKIESVWHIINTIDKIAEKTRIIAFNAELESSSGDSNSENFHIVAAEIRRLAESISEATNEIKEKITAIQHSSDNLIITSEGGTEKIREGGELFGSLEKSFNELKTSCEITAESASNIQTVINSQDELFSQVSVVLQQLNTGFSYFASVAGTTKDEVNRLKNIADKMAMDINI